MNDTVGTCEVVFLDSVTDKPVACKRIAGHEGSHRTRADRTETVYVVIGVRDDGKVIVRLGGGSSSPATPRVYPTLEQAERYWKDGGRYRSKKYSSGPADMTVRIIPLEVVS